MAAEFLGIDPGLSGALARIRQGAPVTCEALDDMPVVKGKRKSTIDRAGLYERLCGLIPGCSLVALEDVSGIPRGWAPSSAASFGRNVGLTEGMAWTLCRQHGVPFVLVPPKVWKNRILLGTAKDKPAAIALASSLFPTETISRSQDGRADALLIAEYARRTVLG